MNSLEEKKKFYIDLVETGDSLFLLNISDLCIDMLDFTGLDRITTSGASYFRFELDFELDPLNGR